MYKIIFILFILFSLFLLNLVISHLFKKIMRRRFINSLKDRDEIFMTFDDGPDPEATIAIIDILKKYNFTSTFFITGNNGERYPEIVRYILKNQNVIGNHGYDHIHPWKRGPIKTITDILKMKKYFSSFEKVPPYRPPYGKFNIITLLYFIMKKQRLIFWDIDPEDYESDDPVKTADNIIKQMHAGSVILLHDGRSYPQKQSDVSVSIRIIEIIAEYASENNLTISYID